MAPDEDYLLKELLTEDEYGIVPEHIREKLETHLEKLSDELTTARSALAVSKINNEQTVTALENAVSHWRVECEELSSQMHSCLQELEVARSRMESAETEVEKLKEIVHRLETENADFRHQRNLAVNELQDAMKTIERRTAAKQRLEEEVQTLCDQLQAAVNAKCEALVKAEAAESLQIHFDLKEKRIEQERECFMLETERLNEELDKQTVELIDLRRELTTTRLTLETRLAEKIEELRIAQEQIGDLTSANNTLKNKMELNLRNLMAQRDNEAKLQRAFDDQVASFKKLELDYKGMNEDAVAKNLELQKGIKEVQELLHKTVEQYEEAQNEKKTLKEKYMKYWAEKDKVIQGLRLELQCANELLSTAKEEHLERAIEELSPTAASLSRHLHPGLPLTQVFMQYAAVTEELESLKNENQSLNEYIAAVLAEIENKTPLLKKQREEYTTLAETLNKMSRNFERTLLENEQLKQNLLEAKKIKDHMERENIRLQQETKDLGKQVRLLLAEVEGHRSRTEPYHPDEDMDSSYDNSSSSEVISRHVVTFRNIQELQTQNQKLLSLVRSLSKKSEEEEWEDDMESTEDPKELVKKQAQQIGELQEQLEKLQGVLTHSWNEVETYRNLISELAYQPGKVLDDEFKLKPREQQSKQVSELKAKVENLEDTLKRVQEKAEAYKIERQATDTFLSQQLESAHTELHDTREKCSKLVAQLEYSEERFKIMQANATTYKNQIAALEGKNKNLTATNVKHEQTISHIKDEIVVTRRKCSQAEMSLENARREIQVLRSSELRLKKELEILGPARKGQIQVLSSLELLRVSLERSQAEERAKLEKQLDESLEECGVFRRRLQEEQDRFRELTAKLQRETDMAKSCLEEEKTVCAQVKDELQAVKEELQKTKMEIDPSPKSSDESSCLKIPFGESEVDVLSKKVVELQNRLKLVESELESTKELFMNEKKHSKNFFELTTQMEKSLDTVGEEYKQYKESTEERLATYATTEAEHVKRIASLESELSALAASTSKSSAELSNQLLKARSDLNAAQEELEQTKQQLNAAKTEITSLSSSLRSTEDKYANEVMQLCSDLQKLTALKLQYADLSAEVTQLRVAKEQAEGALEASKAGWKERELLMEEQLQKTRLNTKNLESQNSVLRQQVETLSSKMATVCAQTSQSASGGSAITSQGTGGSANTSLNSSVGEDEGHSPGQLLHLIKYLRQEKDMAINKFELLRTENENLKSQLESTKKKLDDTKKCLEAEKEESDATVVTTTKYAELLRELETLSAVADSNRILREEKQSLQLQVKELSARVEELEQQLAPLKEQNTELAGRVETLEAENSALRADAGRLRQRVNVLIERSNRTTMDDWKRLEQERESLAKQVMADKEALQKKEDEARVLRQDKARLEEQVNILSRQQQQQMEEVRRLTEELDGMQQRVARLTQELTENKLASTKKLNELTKITEDLGTKEAQLTDARNKEMQIRKIAKKYKTQFEELSKTVEKQEEKNKAAAEAAAAPVEVPSETQEQYRDEGRREQSDRVAELEQQVTSSQQEAESLRKENANLKSAAVEREDKTKSLYKNWRQKLQQLTESKNTLSQQLAEVTQKMETAEQNRGEGSVRLATLKTNYESQIARLEKESADALAEKQREIESLNARLGQLQRQLEKMQGAKPSTSSGGGDKGTTEPPTANIKPMAGVTQQAVAVTPWPGRGDTPLASIRPQSRTLAVLPTNILSSSTSSQSTTVVVPPQQQVHTTGSSSGAGSETVSSSPTSSHTDYMPTTSTASGTIRQVAVQPTVTAQSTTESTQDSDTGLRVGDSQQPQQQQPIPQQVVAMVLPRMEQQQESQQAPSSQASSTSNTVTTSQAGHKRPREAESEAAEEDVTKSKRTHVTAGQQEMFSAVTSDSGVDVEYQVPTSSQRDQEDDMNVMDSEEDVEADDGELPGYDGEGGEMDEDNAADQDNNEVEIIGAEDSSEVPNQSESVSEEAPQQHSEATSSGTSGAQSEPGSTSVERSFSGRSIAPLGRQQQLLLGFEDAGDDSIVPSTPTLFVPRRSDGFGEPVSSPHVPQGRFTFSETNPPTPRAGLAQLASEGMDDTRIDLTQLEESGTGRSVPTTPLQVSPQGDVSAAEGEQEVQAEASNIPSITVTEAGDEEMPDVDEPEEQGDSSADQGMEQEDLLQGAEEGSDGVTSEGEKLPPAEEVEEGREAEASSQSPTKRSTRSGGTARRSGRGPFRGRGRAVRPQPIVWNEPGSSSPRGRGPPVGGRGEPGRGGPLFARGNPRSRRMRGKPKGNFPGQYQMRF